MEEKKSAVRIVISYAKEDLDLLKKLKKHLHPLTMNGDVDIWDDCDILPGTEWSSETGTRLQKAHIILLLISPDYIALDYCYSISVKKALVRHEKGVTHVLPIILRHVGWKQTPFGKLKPLPSSEYPIVGQHWPYIDEAFKNVADSIGKVVEEVKARQLEVHRSPTPETGPGRKQSSQPCDSQEVPQGSPRLPDVKSPPQIKLVH
jgi:hypothetical protein